MTVALLSGCASRETGPAFSELPDTKPINPYDALRARHIMPGDRFPMMIALSPDSPTIVHLTVDQEGYVELPQIGRMHVAACLALKWKRQLWRNTTDVASRYTGFPTPE